MTRIFSYFFILLCLTGSFSCTKEEEEQETQEYSFKQGEAEYTLSPIPAVDQVTVTFKQEHPEILIVVSNITGVDIAEYTYYDTANCSFDLSNEEKGIYFITIKLIYPDFVDQYGTRLVLQ